MISKTDVRYFLSKYGEAMRAKRKNAMLTQVEASACIGCSQAIISHIECGLMLPPKEIEDALIVVYDELAMC